MEKALAVMARFRWLATAMLALGLFHLFTPTSVSAWAAGPTSDSHSTTSPKPSQPRRTVPSPPKSGSQATPGAASEPEKTSTHEPFRVDRLLLGLLVLLIGAKLVGEMAERIRQPAVLGEILFGVLAANFIPGVRELAHQPSVEALAEIGVILLLFETGLESQISEMRRVGWSALLVATLGVVVPSILGWGVSRWMQPGEHVLAHIFVGATLCATSVGITARVLRDLGQVQRSEAQIVLGAAVIDDVLGLVVLAVVSGLIQDASGASELTNLGIVWIVLKAMGFLVGGLLIGRWVSPRLFHLTSRLQVENMLLITALGLCFALAYAASVVGLAPIVGAFAAGLILDPVHYRSQHDWRDKHLEDLTRPISALLVPVFFALTGAKVDLAAALRPEVVAFAGALTLAAVVGKQVCGLGVLQPGLNRVAVGIGMLPRGEVGMIFATIGLGMRLPGPNGWVPVVSGGTFSAIIFMVLFTTIITPPLLKWSLGTARED